MSFTRDARGARVQKVISFSGRPSTSKIAVARHREHPRSQNVIPIVGRHLYYAGRGVKGGYEFHFRLQGSEYPLLNRFFGTTQLHQKA